MVPSIPAIEPNSSISLRSLWSQKLDGACSHCGQHCTEAFARTTKPSHRLKLRDRLSRLNFTQVCKLLGAQGRQLIQRSGKHDILLDEHVCLRGDLYRVTFPDAIVTVTLMAEAQQRLHWNCTACQAPCEHARAAPSLVLEEKMALGLAAPPKERIPVASLSEEALVARALTVTLPNRQALNQLAGTLARLLATAAERASPGQAAKADPRRSWGLPETPLPASKAGRYRVKGRENRHIAQRTSARVRSLEPDSSRVEWAAQDSNL